jgi:hypothetical protein
MLALPLARALIPIFCPSHVSSLQKDLHSIPSAMPELVGLKVYSHLCHSRRNLKMYLVEQSQLKFLTQKKESWAFAQDS